MPVFAERFGALRQEYEMSQDAFAEFLGISRPTVGFYENGSRLPDAMVLRQIALRCDISTDYLLGLSDAMTPDIGIQAASQRFRLKEATLSVIEGFTTWERVAFERMIHSEPFREILAAIKKCTLAYIESREEELMAQIRDTDFTWSELIAIVKRVDDEQERISLFAALSDHKRLLDKVVTMGEDKAATAIMHLQRAAAQLGEEVLEDSRLDAEAMTEEDLRRSMRKLVDEIEAAEEEGETSWQP